MIYSRSGGYQGVSLAIPSNLARRVMVSLARDGRVVRGHLGVKIQDVDPDLAQQFKLPDGRGALVAEVLPNGPADKAGIKSGDVITRFNDKQVSDSSHLRLEVSETAPGTTARVEIIRDGDVKKLDATLDEIPGEEGKTAEARETSNNDTLNGVGVADLDGEARNRAQVPSEIHGVLVTEVAEDSPAYEKGLRAGDVIMEINRTPVKSADQAVKMTTNVKDRRTLLKIWQRNPESGQAGIRFVVVDESKGK
jgi:serine protease Do